MRERVSPFAYICECGKKWVFSTADVGTNRQCDCGRTIIVGPQAVYTEAAVGAQKAAVASVAGSTDVASS